MKNSTSKICKNGRGIFKQSINHYDNICMDIVRSSALRTVEAKF